MVTKRHQLRGGLVGIVMTAVIAALFLLGALDFAENFALDLRQRWNNLEIDPRIVHVDIDDGSVATIGRWPWHHNQSADLIRTIQESGAAAIAIDLLFDKPQDPVPADPMARLDPEIEDAPRTLLNAPASDYVYATLELADAIRQSGRVFLSMQMELKPHGTPRDPPEIRAVKLLAAEPDRTAESLGAKLDVPPGDRPKLWAIARLAQPLMRNFAHNEASLAEPWGETIRALGEAGRELLLPNVLPLAKRTVAEIRVEEILRVAPSTRLNEICKRLGIDPDNTDVNHAALRSALEAWLGMREVELHALPMPSELYVADSKSAPPVGLNPIPSYYKLGRAALGVGAVVVEPDQDGVFRRLPLIVDVNGRAVPHLGLAVAADALRLDLRKARLLGPRMLEIPAAGAPAFHVPLDAAGKLVVHWSPDDANWRTDTTGRHVTAAKLLEVASDRQAIETNSRQAEYLGARVVDLVKGEAQLNDSRIKLAGPYAQKVLDLNQARRAIRLAELRRTSETPEVRAHAASIQRLAAEIAAETDKSAEFAKQKLAEADQMLDDLAHGKLPLEAGETPEHARADILKERAPFAEAAECLRQIEVLRAKNGELSARVARTLNWLRTLLKDKLVLVGYTATAEGDIVPSAIDGRMPGVLAHSSVLNSFLQRRFIRFPPRGVEPLLILLIGALTTYLTATRGFRGTVLSVTAVFVGYVALNAFVLFRLFDMKVELASVVAVILVTSIPVTFYRWWTSDTQRKEIRGQLAQYTSPALAGRIADDPEFVEHWTRVEPREVTCFVSDLKGFTTMAEQVDDPARTRAALNVYLDRMSEVLDRHQALINKFMGDGIFAFFNPPVLPQPETHVREACEAALDCHEALRQLKADHAASGGDELIQRFEMRIGLATGIAGVGDFGSSRKKDYTVIGDVANLAARLESANKVFGTSLMVSGPTHDAVKDLYDFRYLAELQVKGKQRTVPVHEILGRKGTVPEELMMNAEAFAMGVDMYKQRQWDACVRHFTRLLSRRPDDPGPGAYIDACREKKLFPPDDDWAGALELKDK